MKPPGGSNALPLENGTPSGGVAAGWKSHPFLEGLSPEYLSILAECAMPTDFKPEQIIFREGEMANRFYLILAGHVVLEADAKGSRSVPVDLITAGDVLGWSWLFPPYTWNFTARAVDSVRAIFFYGTWLRERCTDDRPFGCELIRRMAAVAIRRLQAARQQLVHLAREPDVV